MSLLVDHHHPSRPGSAGTSVRNHPEPVSGIVRNQCPRSTGLRNYAAKHREHQPSAKARRDAVLLPVLMALWVANRKVYGVHKLWKAARRAGCDLGRDRNLRPELDEWGLAPA